MGEAQGAVWRLELFEVQPALADGDRSGPGAGQDGNGSARGGGSGQAGGAGAGD